jgi:hypothetical protein
MKATSSYVDLVGLKVFSSVELSKKGSAIVTKLVVNVRDNKTSVYGK